MIARCIRSGRYEYRCTVCAGWYYRLARHVKTKAHVARLLVAGAHAILLYAVAVIRATVL